MNAALLALVLATTAVHVEPPILTLGKTASAQLEVLALGANDAPLADAKVEITTSVGTISDVQALGGGRFHARFTPPAEKYPQVALIEIVVRHGSSTSHEWVSLPLQANADLKIDTKHHATVRVDVGPLKYGPVKASSLGRVTLHAIVPPGVAAATVHSVDEAGNSTDKDIPLNPQPFPRARAELSRPSASWIDSRPLEIELFAIEGGGKPIKDAAKVRCLATLGQVGPAVSKGNGVFAFPYRAPGVIASEQDRVSCGPLGAAPAQVSIALEPGPPVSIEVKLDPPAYVAGSGQPVKVRTSVIDAKGNHLKAAQPEVSADFGTVTAAKGGASLQVPDDFGGRRELVVRAVAGANSGQATLKLTPGAAASSRVQFVKGLVHAGDPAQGVLELRDRFGNPAEDEHVAVVSALGHPASVSPQPGGAYQVVYQPEASDPLGPVELDVRSKDLDLGKSDGLTVLPHQAAWGLSVGLGAAAQSNFVHATGFAPRLELGMRLGHSEWQAIVQGELRKYATFTEQQSGINETVAMSGASFGLGARYTLPFSLNWSWHGSLVLGSTRVKSELTAADFPSVNQTETRPSVMLRPASGLSLRAGPGRLFGELQYELSAAKGQLTGTVGGLGFAAGYWIGF
jgi:hypothetical protein